MSGLDWALLIVGGGLGAGGRYVLDGVIMRGRTGVFPLGILIVNITGSFLLGLLTGLGRDGAARAARPARLGLAQSARNPRRVRRRGGARADDRRAVPALNTGPNSGLNGVRTPRWAPGSPALDTRVPRREMPG